MKSEALFTRGRPMEKGQTAKRAGLDHNPRQILSFVTTRRRVTFWKSATSYKTKKRERMTTRTKVSPMQPKQMLLMKIQMVLFFLPRMKVSTRMSGYLTLIVLIICVLTEIDSPLMNLLMVEMCSWGMAHHVKLLGEVQFKLRCMMA